MTKIFYTSAAVFIAAFFSYHAGRRIAAEQCRADSAASNVAEVVRLQNIKKDAHEKAITTGVADIRMQLRQKYTIAD